MTVHPSRLFVPGTPAPQGSMKAFVDKAGHAHVTSDNEHTMPWRQRIVACVRLLLPGGVEYPAGPIALGAEFVFPRRAADRRVLRVVEWSPAHTTKPDLDKLVRAVLDALTGILWADDAQVTRIVAHKRYATQGIDGSLEEPGAHLAWVQLPQDPRPAAQQRRQQASGSGRV